MVTPALDFLAGMPQRAEPRRLRHSSRSLPLRLSTKAFWTGLAGSMKRSRTPVRSDQSNRARLVPSEPLHLFWHAGPHTKDERFVRSIGLPAKVFANSEYKDSQ